MSPLSGFSGATVIAMLEKHFGFAVVSQKGSHVKLRRILERKTVTAIVPNHKELAPGTLKNVLRQANIEVADFLNKT